MIRVSFRCAWVGILVAAAAAAQAQNVTLVGASQFNEDHAHTKTMREFERLVTECYSGDVTFDLHLNSELGLDKDYFENMSQGIAVDYAVVSPVPMSTFSQMALLMDMPFLFRDLAHWNAAIEAGALDPIADDILENANVRIIGYAGGSTRNVIATKPVTNLSQLQGLPIRVMGRPIWTHVFDALGTDPRVIPYSEVYDAIQNGVIEAAENAAAGIWQMDFYKVAPEVALTQHVITVRPLAFSNPTYERLDPELQGCIDESGVEAGKLGRDIESNEEMDRLAEMVNNGLINVYRFDERESLFELALDEQWDIADDLNALDIFENIQSIQGGTTMYRDPCDKYPICKES